MAATAEARDLATVAANAAADKKAIDVVLLDVSDRLVITDVFVIASAPNERQVGAIVDNVEEKLRAVGHKPVRREGTREGRWVLMDYVDVVVHIQHDEERSFYDLERLWKDCPRIEVDGLDERVAAAATSDTAASGGAADTAASGGADDTAASGG
ncbi:ribosome silencing factor, partial [Saccharomonospora saliphila]|uniref:ribosome silencing factor n=1 Tax=Saccharomonospora saliphila TaxID=369829 RepID=UPI00049025CB